MAIRRKMLHTPQRAFCGARRSREALGSSLGEQLEKEVLWLAWQNTKARWAPL